MDLAPERLILQLTEEHLFRFLAFVGFSAIWGVKRWLSKGTSGKWFALMTAVWVLVNLLVAFLLKNHLILPEPDEVAQTVQHVVFWIEINLLLDLGYLLCAYFLVRRSRHLRKDSRILRGFGQAIYLQGVGLILLDVLFLGFVFRAF
jgi:hypothetical protein